MSPDHRSPPPPSRLDRTARLVLPRLSDLGGPGTLLAPLVLVAIFSLLGAVGMDPMVEAAFRNGSPGAGVTLRTWIWLLGVLSPVFAMVKGLVLGGAAWSVLVLLGGAPAFRAVVSAVLYGEALLSLQGLWISFVLHLRGVASMAEPSDLRVVTGLDVLADASSPVSVALAQGLSVFHVAWVVVLCLAFAHAAGTTRIRSSVAAAAVWCLVVGAAVLRASTS